MKCRILMMSWGGAACRLHDVQAPSWPNSPAPSLFLRVEIRAIRPHLVGDADAPDGRLSRGVAVGAGHRLRRNCEQHSHDDACSQLVQAGRELDVQDDAICPLELLTAGWWSAHADLNTND